MSLIQSIVFGFVQGCTEFLPVSSSAHLVLLPLFTGWADPGLAFDVALHWGTLVAVVLYFRKDVVVLINGFFGSLRGERAHQNVLPWLIIVATVPGAIIGYAFEKQAETIFRSPWVLTSTLSLVGLFLLISDRTGSKSLRLENLDIKKSLLIGFSQGVAIIPGVSRSGITISVGLLLGLERAEAVRFSFFLSIPIILGAGILKIRYLFSNGGDIFTWIALGASAISGFAAIHVLIRYVRTKTFTPFVVYRFILAAVVLGWLLVRMP